MHTHPTKLLLSFLLVLNQNHTPHLPSVCWVWVHLNLADFIGIFHTCPQIMFWNADYLRPLNNSSQHNRQFFKSFYYSSLLRLISGPSWLAPLIHRIPSMWLSLCLLVPIIFYCLSSPYWVIILRADTQHYLEQSKS